MKQGEQTTWHLSDAKQSINTWYWIGCERKGEREKRKTGVPSRAQQIKKLSSRKKPTQKNLGAKQHSTKRIIAKPCAGNQFKIEPFKCNCIPWGETERHTN
jgi:hypothetical protein